jgi:hypothetical protein
MDGDLHIGGGGAGMAKIREFVSIDYSPQVHGNRYITSRQQGREYAGVKVYGNPLHVLVFRQAPGGLGVFKIKQVVGPRGGGEALSQALNPDRVFPGEIKAKAKHGRSGGGG